MTSAEQPVDRRATTKVFRLLAVWVGLAGTCGATGGCMGVHGRHSYIATGRVLGSHDGRPLAGCRLAVVEAEDCSPRRLRGFDPAKEPDFWQGFTRSDDDGRFKAHVSGGEFTVYLLLGFIPLNLPPRISPPLDEMLRIFVRENGAWRSKEIRPSPECQTKVVDDVRYMELGDIRPQPPVEQEDKQSSAIHAAIRPALTRGSPLPGFVTLGESLPDSRFRVSATADSGFRHSSSGSRHAGSAFSFTGSAVSFPWLPATKCHLGR